MQICRSDDQWHALGPFTPGCGTPADPCAGSPNPGDVCADALIESNIVTITGITGSVSVSISGQGSPQFRIAGGSWVTSGTITNGQTLQLRLTSNAANSTTNSATVTAGTASDQWDVTTEEGGPTGCPNVGDQCDDDTDYIGESGGNKIYAAEVSMRAAPWNGAAMTMTMMLIVQWMATPTRTGLPICRLTPTKQPRPVGISPPTATATGICRRQVSWVCSGMEGHRWRE